MHGPADRRVVGALRVSYGAHERRRERVGAAGGVVRHLARGRGLKRGAELHVALRGRGRARARARARVCVCTCARVCAYVCVYTYIRVCASA